jgi:hypothetical protein
MGGDPEANRTVKEDDMALGCEPLTSTLILPTHATEPET